MSQVRRCTVATSLVALMLVPALSSARDEGGGRPTPPYDRAADAGLVNTIGRDRCQAFDRSSTWPLGSANVARTLCRIEVDKPQAGWITFTVKRGYGSPQAEGDFSRLDSDFIYTAPLAQLQPRVEDFSGTTSSVRVRCTSGACIQLKGWGNSSVAPGQSKRLEFDEKVERFDFPLAVSASEKTRVMRALSRMIAPDNSDEAFCSTRTTCVERESPALGRYRDCSPGCGD
jgi:hypothetical protein